MSFTFRVATAAPPPLAEIVDRLGDGDLCFEESELGRLLSGVQASRTTVATPNGTTTRPT